MDCAPSSTDVCVAWVCAWVSCIVSACVCVVISQLLKVKGNPALGASHLAHIIQFEAPTEAEVKAAADLGVTLHGLAAMVEEVRVCAFQGVHEAAFQGLRVRKWRGLFVGVDASLAVSVCGVGCCTFMLHVVGGVH